MKRPDVLLLPCGKALSPEHLELGYFAAAVCCVEPERLRLSHLIAHLQRTAFEPRRRATDPPRPAPPQRHGASCPCAICATRRRRVTA